MYIDRSSRRLSRTSIKVTGAVVAVAVLSVLLGTVPHAESSVQQSLGRSGTKDEPAEVTKEDQKPQPAPVSEGIAEMAAWAEEVLCVGPGCVEVSLQVFTDCAVPIIHIDGSFIISHNDLMEQWETIDELMGIRKFNPITDRLSLLLVDDSSVGNMRQLQQAGIEITLNAVHFHSQLWGWYPFSTPQIPGQDAFQPPMFVAAGPVATVATVDTGIIESENENLNHGVAGDFIDQLDLFLDAFSGHGPAIADLTGDMLGLPESSEARDASVLKQLAYAEGVNEGLLVHLDGTRMFDSASLLAAVAGLPARVDIVNLSLGIKSCPALSQMTVENAETGTSETVQIDPLRQLIIDNPEVIFVAAAGNSNSTEPTYPAGWTTDPEVPNIISVGSMSQDGTRSCFSDHGDWIDYYAVGENVLAEHGTMGQVTWTGTSFAAPQVSAALAAGLPPDAVALPADQVGPPSVDNLLFCQ